MSAHASLVVRFGSALALVAVWSATAAAGDFSIENKVYDGKELIASGTTLLVDGKAYDFLSQPDETIIIAPGDGRIILLDNARKLRADVTTAEVANFCAQLREKARTAGGEQLRFFAEPAFRESLDAETHELKLESPQLEYRARTIAPPDADVLKRYEQFLFWQTQLNALLNPGAPPPTARLKLNEALARRQQLAERVTLRKTSALPGFSRSLQSEHCYTWQVGDPDRRRIEQANESCASYRTVSAAEYLRPSVEAARR